MKMKRVNFHLKIKQIKAIRRLSAKTELPIAEIVRRSIDMLLKKEGEKKYGTEIL